MTREDPGAFVERQWGIRDGSMVVEAWGLGTAPKLSLGWYERTAETSVPADLYAIKFYNFSYVK